jgi:CheY-like chemotaxis protein
MAVILVVEDEFLLADMLGMMLEEAGHDVRKAQHGVAALKLMETEIPQLIISDFMMPLMTGLELAEAVRANDRLKALPIILVSGAQGAIGRSRPEMFEAVVDKPYDMDTLLEIVDRLLAPPYSS